MRFRFPVRALRLHGARLAGAGEGRVSLFPFFGADGVVTHLMMADGSRTTIEIAELERAVVDVPLAGRISLTGLTAIDDQHLSTLTGLWHYDPWWVLERHGFADHWATPALKRTNCADSLTEDVRSVWYAHDLARVTRVTVQIADDTSTSRPWSPALLERPASPSGRSTRPRGWVLDPIWSEATKRDLR